MNDQLQKLIKSFALLKILQKASSYQKPDNNLEELISKVKISNLQKTELNILYKSEMKRHLDDKKFFKSWEDSYTLHKSEPHPTRLIHYSRQPGLKSISPKHMGTGTGGDFNRRFNPSKIKDFPHTTFYYVKDTPEDIVKHGSMSKYTVKLNPDHQLYDMSKDKDGLIQQAVKENQGAWNYENVLRKIKDSGYDGIWSSESDHPVISNTVQMFHELPVEKEMGVNDNVQPVGE